MLVDDVEVEQWVRDLADRARDHPEIELAAVIACRGGGRKALDHLLKLESRFLMRHVSGRDDGAWIGDLPLVQIPVPASGLTSFDDTDYRDVEDLQLDAIVDCGQESRGGPLCDAAKDGMIAIVTSGGTLAGAAAGFVDVLEGRPVTEFAIERITRAGCEVLFQGSITTQLFYSDNRAALYARAMPYLFRAVERLATGKIPSQPDRAPEAIVSRMPGTAEVLSYLARSFARVGRKAWRHAIGREWNWGVAYTFAAWQSADLRSGTILPKLPGTFVADPFAVEAAGKRYIFVEEFPYSTRKGVISVFEVDEKGAERLGVALEEPYHLSFPFVFRRGDRFYMVPEGQGGGAMILYECEEFPLKWARKKVLMPRVCADTVIFEHGSRWWMLTSIKGEGPAENSAELHVFHAEDPFGEWQPHRMNPVVMDASKGRNGGLLRDDEGGVYRVAQRARFRTYGDAFAIYRIDELTPDSYRESLVREVQPDFFPNLAGAHHMHSHGGLTVYDFSRDERP